MSLGTVPTGPRPVGLAVNPAGTRVFVVNSANNTLQSYDLRGGLPVSRGTVPTGNTPWAVTVTPTGTHVIVVNAADNTLQTYDVSSNWPVSLGTVPPGPARREWW